jgi:hypothetical protein
MGSRRMLPGRDPPARAGTVTRCPPEPRRGLAAIADFTNSLGAVADSCGRTATAGVGVYSAERRIRGEFQQPLSGERSVECLA